MLVKCARVLGIFGFTSLFGINWNNKKISEDLELVQVQVIARHGARTPLATGGQDGMSTLPWKCEPVTQNSMDVFIENEGEYQRYDTYKESLHTKDKPLIYNNSCVDGQLTLLGMEQSLNLGQELRERYVNVYQFLNPRLVTNSVWMRSSNTTRTILTARQIMYGLYPRGTRYEFSVHVRSPKDENLYPRSSCDKFAYLKKHLRGSDNLSPMLRDILSKTDDEYWKSRKSVAVVVNNLNGLVDHDFPLPKGLTLADYDTLQNLGGAQYAITYSTEPIQRLSIGRFLGDLRNNIGLAMQRPTRLPKFIIFAGHDNTLGPLLVTLNAFSRIGKHPRMGSALIIELWKHNIENSFYISMYWYDPAEKFIPLPINGYPQFCPIKEFMDMTKKVVPTDYENECKV